MRHCETYGYVPHSLPPASPLLQWPCPLSPTLPGVQGRRARVGMAWAWVVGRWQGQFWPPFQWWCVCVPCLKCFCRNGGGSLCKTLRFSAGKLQEGRVGKAPSSFCSAYPPSQEHQGMTGACAHRQWHRLGAHTTQPPQTCFRCCKVLAQPSRPRGTRIWPQLACNVLTARCGALLQGFCSL